jgi:hypothetical protein
MPASHIDRPGRRQMEGWLSLIKEVAEFLPDLDMAVNTLEGRRVFAPWDDVAYALRIQSSELQSGNTTVKEKLPEILLDLEWLEADETQLIKSVRAACAPRSLAHSGLVRPPALSVGLPEQSFKGYVQN